MPRSPVQTVVDAAGVERPCDTIACVLEADRKPDRELRRNNTRGFVIASKPWAVN
jgi:hypothetical protein